MTNTPNEPDESIEPAEPQDGPLKEQGDALLDKHREGAPAPDELHEKQNEASPDYDPDRELGASRDPA